MADKGVLIQRIASPGDRLDFEHRIHPSRTICARELAERRLRSSLDGTDLAFKYDLGVGRNVERYGFAADQRYRPLQHSALNANLVGNERRETQ